MKKHMIAIRFCSQQLFIDSLPAQRLPARVSLNLQLELNLENEENFLAEEMDKVWRHCAA